MFIRLELIPIAFVLTHNRYSTFKNHAGFFKAELLYSWVYISGLAEPPTVFDVNECDDATLNDCSINAICTNTEGSYECTCTAGKYSTTI